MRFWDSSAVVPILVEQSTSPMAAEWLTADPHVAMWTLTPVEITSALARLARERAISEDDALRADERAQELVAASHVIVNGENTKALARRLLRVHALRAGDALQLGAALIWAGSQPQGHILHTLDDRLAMAARREGFSVSM